MNNRKDNVPKKGQAPSSSGLVSVEQEQVRQFEEAFRRSPALAVAWLSERKGKISPPLSSAIAAKICKSEQPDDKKIAIFSQFGPLGLWKELEKSNTSPYTIVGRHWKGGLSVFMRLAERQGLPRPTLRVIAPYADNRVFMNQWLEAGGDINTKVDGKNLLTLFVEQVKSFSGVKMPEMITFAHWFIDRKGAMLIDNRNNIYSLPIAYFHLEKKPGHCLDDWWKTLNELGGNMNKDEKIVDALSEVSRYAQPILRMAFDAGFSPNSPQLEKTYLLGSLFDEQAATALEEFIRQEREKSLGGIFNKPAEVGVQKMTNKA